MSPANRLLSNVAMHVTVLTVHPIVDVAFPGRTLPAPAGAAG